MSKFVHLILLFFLTSSITKAQEKDSITIIYDEPDSHFNKGNSNEIIYGFVETNPVYPFGSDSLSKYIKQSIYFPEKYIGKITREFVLIRFVVEKDGSLTNLKVLSEDNTPEFVEQARNTILCMPKWIPGKTGIEFRRVYIKIPFWFCPDNCVSK